MAKRYSALVQANTHEEWRRKRIKLYRGFIDRWQWLEREFGIDLSDDINDLERWIRVLLDTNEQRIGSARTKRRAGSGH